MHKKDKHDPSLEKANPKNLSAAKIFISYSRKDEEFANVLKSFLDCVLNNRGVSIFMDTRIEPGVQWHKRIKAELQSANVFLLLLSDHAIKSEWVKYEVNEALKRSQPSLGNHNKNNSLGELLFLPIVISEVDEMFDYIQRFYQVGDLRNPYTLRRDLNRLYNRVSEFLGPQIRGTTRKAILSDQIDMHVLLDVVRKERYLAQLLDAGLFVALAEADRHLDTFFRLDDTSNTLLAPYTISHKERQSKEAVWVVSENFNNDLYDEAITQAVKDNLDAGLNYAYFCRETKKSITNKVQQIHDQKVISINLPADVFIPFEELVIYDPLNEENRWGYIQFSYEGRSNTQKVFVLCPQAILSEAVGLLLPYYEQCPLGCEVKNTKQQDTAKLEKEVGGNEQKDVDLQQKLRNEKIEERTKLVPFQMKSNFDLYRSNHIVLSALEKVTSTPISETNVALSTSHKKHTMLEANFFADFMAKINDVNSIQSAQDKLVDPELISMRERSAKNEVWIISPLLYGDVYEEEIRNAIIKNITDEKDECPKYKYFYFQNGLDDKKQRERDDEIFQLRKTRHKKLFTQEMNKVQESSDCERLYESIFSFYPLITLAIFPYYEVVLYDPHDRNCFWGYMHFKYGDQKNKDVSMKLPKNMLIKIADYLYNFLHGGIEYEQS